MARSLRHLCSLREYIDELAAIDGVQTIDVQVDWKYEIGAIIRRGYDLRAPAPLFDHIKDSPGFRVLGAPGGLSSRPEMRLARIALSLGLPPQTSGQGILEALVSAHQREPIPHRMLNKSDAPCKENIMAGDEINVLAFPAPWPSPSDGGRFIQTYGLNIARTPDGSWIRELAVWIDSNILLQLASAPFDEQDEALVPKAGSCANCPRRTGFNKLLFADVRNDSCTDPQCFHEKLDRMSEGLLHRNPSWYRFHPHGIRASAPRPQPLRGTGNEEGPRWYGQASATPEALRKHGRGNHH